MSDIEFIDGLILKPPRKEAPDYVIARGSIKREDLLAWLAKRDGEWVNFDIKAAKSGKWYAAVDNWKPDSKRQDAPRGGGYGKPAPSGGDFHDDDLSGIPFVTSRGTF